MSGSDRLAGRRALVTGGTKGIGAAARNDAGLFVAADITAVEGCASPRRPTAAGAFSVK